ncbi:hypothetical protein [Devosia sp. XK-2]|uniref:hypothetical protein n=1 Tax=Devosia sp. XK-2 TaxID=3126689 RepID=UPI0030D36C34
MNLWARLDSSTVAGWVSKAIGRTAELTGTPAAAIDQDMFWHDLEPRRQRQLDQMIGDTLFADLVDMMGMPTCLSDFSQTSFAAEASAIGLHFDKRPMVPLPMDAADVTEVSLEHALQNASHGDSMAIYGSDLVDGEFISRQRLLEHLSPLVGVQTHASIIVRSPDDVYLFLCHVQEGEVFSTKENYKMTDGDIKEVLEALMDFYATSGTYYPVCICFDPKFYAENNFSVVYGRIPEGVIVARLPLKYDDEPLPYFCVIPYSVVSAEFSAFISTEAGQLACGELAISNADGTGRVECAFHILLPSRFDLFPLVALHPKLTQSYYAQLLHLREREGAIGFQQFEASSNTYNQMMVALWSVFAAPTTTKMY